MNHAIHVDYLNKTFAKKSALVDLELTIAPGEMVALIGACGSGKSTLLRHLTALACCDKSNGGSVKVLGREVQTSGRLNGKVRRLRADIGYIFQQSNRVNRLSVLDIVLFGCLGRMPRWRDAMPQRRRHLTTPEAAKGCQALNMPLPVGRAPNVVRGGAHSVNVAAAGMVAGEARDILSSACYPAVQSVWLQAKRVF